MHKDNAIQGENLRRIGETVHLMAVIGILITLPFLLLAIKTQIYPRILYIGLSLLGFGVAWFLSKGGTYHRLAPWLCLTAMWLGISNAVGTNGGGITNVIVLWYPVTVCIAGLIGNSRFCIIWSLISGLSVVVVFGLDFFAFELPNFTPATQQKLLFTMHVFSQCAASIVLVIGYQRKLNRFEKAVDEKLEQLKLFAEQTEVARDRALQAVNEKHQFMRNMSHEFRTPLNSIIGFSERLLKKLESDSPYISPVSVILRNGRSLHYFVNELLVLDAIESTPLELNSVNLYQLVNNILDANRSLAEGYGAHLNFVNEGDQCHLLEVRADIARLSQALSNILMFCLRQTKEGDITVMVAEEPEYLSVSFIDSAAQLSNSAYESLFETHYEFVLSNDKDLPCSALSLKIAGIILTNHSARYCAGPHANGGNVINIKLPLGL